VKRTSSFISFLFTFMDYYESKETSCLMKERNSGTVREAFGTDQTNASGTF
jgi:hypothetical protein